MKILVKVKQIGKKHSLLEKELNLEVNPQCTVAEFIQALVKEQVESYLQKPDEKSILPVLSKTETDEMIESGKVHFGTLQKNKNPDIAEAQQTALQAFEDGMYAVFFGETELNGLSQSLNLNETTPFTFIRLTFLAGSYW